MTKRVVVLIAALGCARNQPVPAPVATEQQPTQAQPSQAQAATGQGAPG